MGKLSLVMLDTDHIKQYVFPTDKLKEIRGASSVLDRLNRHVMWELAVEITPSLKKKEWRKIYANGGCGLFVIDREQADEFGQSVQKAYRAESKDGASLTYAIWPLPDDMPDEEQAVLNTPIKDRLELLRYRLREKKDCPSAISVLPSHPFVRACDSCGLRYAEGKDRTGGQDPDEQDRLYCASCLAKREEDQNVKKSLERFLERRPEKQRADTSSIKSPLWRKIIGYLQEDDNYNLLENTERPHDFNDFRRFAGSKEYLGLIYADGNSMGTQTDKFKTLRELHNFAEVIDNAAYAAVCEAIRQHLQVQEFSGQNPMFPFDLLMLGGDDIMMVTRADKTLDVALTIAKTFREEAQKHALERDPKLTSEEINYSLSVAVILAPIKYPFGMLRNLAEEALKHAKKRGTRKTEETVYGDTLINFMVVTGSISQDFEKVYDGLHKKYGRVGGRNGEVEFYATLRPYTVEGLERLLKAIREGKRLALGRTKLHQVREAVRKMNLTGSVMDGLAVLRNWRERQREFVLKQVYTLGNHYQERYRDENDPGTLFPRVTFPWFADGPKTYRTSLLDFVELYDFVGGEENAGEK